MSLSPPPPFPDFDFNFDPALLATHPLPLPSSADLFSVDETTDLLGFLETLVTLAGIRNHRPPEPSTSGRPKRSNTRSSSAREKQQLRRTSPRRDSATPSNASESSSSHTNEQTTQSSTAAASTSTSTSTSTSATSASSNARNKPLLSTPQKRLNHIMSEQKRRNAIRDGYAQLIALLAPAGAAPGAVIGMMPQRGRPKGSGSRGGKNGGAAGQNTAKGKSGVLFRAVEYIRWLEEGREALREEVLRVEAAAGFRL